MRLLTTAPRRCSACYGQYLDRPHVDFAAAYDGPPLDVSNPRAGNIDWIVLCDHCIRSAHRLLPADADKQAAIALRADLQATQEALGQMASYTATLEAAVAAKPTVEYVVPHVEPVTPVAVPDEHEPGEDEQLEGPPPTVLPTKPETAKRKNRYAKDAA